nr:hypothetical protein [Tanacetum cinerariifolium]
MSSDNAQSAVTYTSISSDSNGPSWGIPLMNAGEITEIEPYKEVAQQGQVPPLSPAYVLNPMKLDEHVLVYILEPDNPEYHEPSDDDILVEDQPHADGASPTDESPGYIADSDSMGEDDDEDPKEDPNEDHEHEDADTKEEEPSEGSDETEPFEDDEIAVTPPPKHRGARISVRPQTPMAASTQALIDALAAGSPPFPLPPTSLSYNHAPLGHRTNMIRIRDDILKEDMPPQRRFILTASLPGCDVAESSAAAARAPRGQYDFVDIVVAGHSLVYSPRHDAQTIARAVDRVEEVETLKIDVLRGHMTAYETELQEVRQAYLSFEAQNRALLARLETLETHISHMEWQRQSAEDLAVTQMMRIYALEDRARTDTMEDADSSC